MPVSGRAAVADHVVFETVGDEIVLLDTKQGTFFGLNPTGARFWELLGEQQDLGRIRDAMLDEFNVDATALDHDLEELVTQLLEQGLIVRTDVEV